MVQPHFRFIVVVTFNVPEQVLNDRTPDVACPLRLEVVMFAPGDIVAVQRTRTYVEKILPTCVEYIASIKAWT